MGKVSLTQILECSSGGYLGTQSWSVMNGILSKSSKIVHFSQICYTFMSCSVIHYQIGVPPNPKTLVHLRLMMKRIFLWKMLEMVWNPWEYYMTWKCNNTCQDCMPTYPQEFLCSNLPGGTFKNLSQRNLFH